MNNRKQPEHRARGGGGDSGDSGQRQEDAVSEAAHNIFASEDPIERRRKTLLSSRAAAMVVTDCGPSFTKISLTLLNFVFFVSIAGFAAECDPACLPA